MVRPRSPSSAARAVLALMTRSGSAWHHGYDLCRQTGIKSGTLYPLLMRLESQGYLVAEWQAPTAAGRPARHVYRLTDAGRQYAAENPPPSPAPTAAGPRVGLA